MKNEGKHMSSLVQAQNQDIDSKKELIKRTMCKGATDDELELFLHVCKKTGLDPLVRQIYAVTRYTKDGNQMTIQTGIDGYRLIADRSGRYAPGREPEWKYDEKGRLISATATVRKMTEDGTWHEVAATAFYSEYVQTYKDGNPTSFWCKMGHTMLAKCAEALALRKAFPAELSGVYTAEEMSQADQLEEAEVVKEPPKVFTKTIEQCTKAGLRFWELLRKNDESLSPIMPAELPWYILTCQQEMPGNDIYDRLPQLAQDPQRFMGSLKMWYVNRGKLLIENSRYEDKAKTA